MVAGQLDVHGLGAVEPEHDAPVGAHADAPPTGPIAAQRVQPIPRQVKIAGPVGDLEVGQDAADTRHEVRRQPPRAIPLEERRRPLCANLTAAIVSRSGTFYSAAKPTDARQPRRVRLRYAASARGECWRRSGARSTGRAAGHGFDQPPQQKRGHQGNASSSIGRRKKGRKALRWSGWAQRRPRGIIQAFHFYGTNCGTISLSHCFYLIIGGEGGIRTPGPLRVNGFQDRRFRPLSHLSGMRASISDYVSRRERRALRPRPVGERGAGGTGRPAGAGRTPIPGGPAAPSSRSLNLCKRY